MHVLLDIELDSSMPVSGIAAKPDHDDTVRKTGFHQQSRGDVGRSTERDDEQRFVCSAGTLHQIGGGGAGTRPARSGQPASSSVVDRHGVVSREPAQETLNLVVASQHAVFWPGRLFVMERGGIERL